MLLHLLATAALAQSPSGAERALEPAYVLVDANAWLYEAPSDDAARLRATTLDVAPEHARAPVVILTRKGEVDGFVRVRVLTHPARVGPGGRPLAPDVVPGDWRHCYPQPPGLAQLGLDLWVRQVDVLPVLAQPVDLTTTAGDRVHLEPGLALQGTGPTYRVVGHHLTVLADLPSTAVARSYPLERTPLTSPGLVAVRADPAQADGRRTEVVHPTWQGDLDARGDVLALRVRPARGAQPALELRDRCMRVTPHAPLPAVPGLDREALRGASTLPIQVGMGSPITRRDGTVLGQVSGGDYILWSRASCAWEGEALGLCCDPPAGIQAEGADTALCFQSELPLEAIDRTYKTVIGRAVDRVASASLRAAGARPSVRWDPPRTQGPVPPEALSAAFDTERPTLLYCYERAIRRDPDQRGRVSLRFGVASDGHGRAPRILHTDLDDEAMLDCISRRIQGMLVPEQVGEVATIVEIDLVFEPNLPEG